MCLKNQGCSCITTHMSSAVFGPVEVLSCEADQVQTARTDNSHMQDRIFLWKKVMNICVA